MSSSAVEVTPLAQDVRITDDELVVPLVDGRTNDRMQIVLQEILEDKIYLDTSGELREREQQLPAPEGAADE